MEPKRIVSIKGTGSKTTFEFHLNVFESILGNVNDENKLVIISTFGQPRIGKTFLLNYVNRYLRAMNEDDWLGDNDPEFCLSGFPWSDNDPDSNRGIWLSSQPITIICSDGQTVDVLLLDTKGTSNNPETFNKESEIFTAVCVQLSSCVLFNVTNEISVDTIKKLSQDVNLTQTKIERSDTDVPHFVFCVRNHQLLQRSQSGYQHLKKALISSSESGRSIRNYLSNNSCVLMPFPGEMTQWRRYNGNAACLEQGFTNILHEFIPATFDPDCLATLAVSPEKYVAKFKLLAKAYVYTLPFRASAGSREAGPSNFTPPPTVKHGPSRRPRKPEVNPLPIPSISEDAPNHEFYVDSFKQFTTNMTRAYEDPAVTESELKSNFERYQQEAVEYFTDQDLDGDYRGIRAQEDKLTDDIAAYFRISISNWKAEQNQIQGNIQAVFDDTVSCYEDDMTEYCRKPNQSRSNLLKFNKMCSQQAEEQFEAETVKYPTHLVQPYLEKLSEEIQSKLAYFEQKITQQESSREEALIDFAETAAIQVYKHHMQTELKKTSFLKSGDLLELNDRVYRLAIGEFRKQVSFESFEKTGSLTKEINNQFQVYKQKNDLVKARVQADLKHVSDLVMLQYKQDLNELTTNPRISVEGFQSDHESLIGAVRAKIFSYRNEENSCVIEEHWQMLYTDISEIFLQTTNEVREFVSTRRAKFDVDANQLVEMILNDFKISTNDEALRRRNKQQVNKLCSDGKNEILEKFRLGAEEYDEDIRVKYLEHLEGEIDSECSDVLERFRLMSKESQLHLKEAMLNAKEYYDAEMAKKFVPSTKFYKPADLIDIDRKIFAEIRSQFCAELFPPQIAEVQNSLKPIFDVFERKNNMNTPTTTTAIGIDLGTTYSCVAVYHAGEVKVLEDENGKRTMPSYVGFIDGQEVVGHAAKGMAYQHPKNTVYDAKRILAKDFNDIALQEDMKNWPFQVVDEDGSPRITLQTGHQHNPEMISSKILKSLKSVADKYLKTTVQDVVITVPAYFNDGQRNATRDAGELAGLNVLSIINEPTAAALAYFWEHKQAGPINVLVYDLGGGTFDVSVLTMQNGNVEVLATGGNGHLGGEDFDNAIIDHCLVEFQKKTGFALAAWKNSEHAIEREQYTAKRALLKNIVEDVKISLSHIDTRHIIREALHNNVDLNVPLTRELFNRLNQVKFDETLRIVEETLKESGLNKEDIHEVILIGGSSKILKIQEMLMEFFGKDLLDHSVNPDEAVAKGAAIQAAILSGNQEQKLKNISLQDVTPLTLGLGIENDAFSKMILRNTRVPVSKVETFYKKPSKTNITLKVYEGEERLASHNHYLGTYTISGLEKSIEDAAIKVTMSINKENILSVNAEGAGISQKFVVQRQGRLTHEEKRRYLEGEDGADEDY